MNNENTNFVCVLKTGKTHEHDIAANALKDKGVPFYREQETSSGLRLAMPFQSSMGPGTFFSILVPEIAVDDAKSILAELPIDLTTDPDLWHFRPNKKAKRFWKIFIWINLGIALLFLGFSLINP
jgi:hypothetical protein